MNADFPAWAIRNAEGDTDTCVHCGAALSWSRHAQVDNATDLRWRVNRLSMACTNKRMHQPTFAGPERTARTTAALLQLAGELEQMDKRKFYIWEGVS